MEILIMEMNGYSAFFNMAACSRVIQSEIQIAIYDKLTEFGMKFIT
ncbi:hypothetical protein [Cytobacillus oceanisediminis]|nr:hypothetical protein [Cytobacillus oceanisediminis]